MVVVVHDRRGGGRGVEEREFTRIASLLSGTMGAASQIVPMRALREEKEKKQKERKGGARN